MRRLLSWNKIRWYYRLPLKATVLALTYLVVCFPHPALLIRHIKHWSDPNALIEPDAPALQPWVAELHTALEDNLTPQQTIRKVERFVYDKVPYEWDWNTWGMADYLPTVGEVLRMGKEDCDGQAVVAASLARSLGIDAHLVGNFAHIWVATKYGAFMGPQKNKAVVVTEKGVRFNAEGFTQLPRAIGFGIAVFPFLRELIILLVFWFLLLRADHCIITGLFCVALMSVGLLLLRAGGDDYQYPRVFLQVLGLVTLSGGTVWMLLTARRPHDLKKTTSFLTERADS